MNTVPGVHRNFAPHWSQTNFLAESLADTSEASSFRFRPLRTSGLAASSNSTDSSTKSGSDIRSTGSLLISKQSRTRSFFGASSKSDCRRRRKNAFFSPSSSTVRQNDAVFCRAGYIREYYLFKVVVNSTIKLTFCT